jgi:putative peptide zinc metalloprotease protein
LARQALGVPIREAGAQLLFWPIPMTHVDRTDAYRGRSRAGRSAVAAIGILVDLLAGGLNGLLIVAASTSFTAGQRRRTGLGPP